MNILPNHWLHYVRLLRRNASYLARVGWTQSARVGRPVDADGNPVPWMNYAVIAFLKGRLTSDLQLFEYDSGQSTHFFAERVRSVTSTESDRDWYETVSLEASDNVHLHLHEDPSANGDYATSIWTAEHPFDVVVIDGFDRPGCMTHALRALTPRGVVILDDSDRPAYRNTLDKARTMGFKTLDFEGLKPCSHKLYRTTIVYRDGNCLGL